MTPLRSCSEVKSPDSPHRSGGASARTSRAGYRVWHGYDGRTDQAPASRCKQIRGHSAFMVFSNTVNIGTAQRLPERPMSRVFGRHRYSLLLCLEALAACCVIFGPVLAQTADKIKVVASTSDLAAIAAEVGGNRVQVEYLVGGNQEPHFAQAKPSYLLKLRRAELLIVVGLLFEGPWLTETGRNRPSLLSQAGNPRVQPGAPGYFDASHYVEVLEIPKPPLIPKPHHLHNPYYWLDPANGPTTAQALAQKLSEIRPQDASYFEDRVQTFTKPLSDAESACDAEMKPYRDRRVATYQRS